MLDPVLDSPIQQRDGTAGENPSKCHLDDEGIGASLVWLKAKTTVTVHPGENKAQEHLMCVDTWREGTKATESGSFQICPVTRISGHKLKHKRFPLNIRKHCEDDGVPEEVAQGVFGVSILGNTQKLSSGGSGLPCSRWPCLSRGFEQDNLPSPLLTSAVLWFCEMPNFRILGWKQKYLVSQKQSHADLLTNLASLERYSLLLFLFPSTFLGHICIYCSRFWIFKQLTLYSWWSIQKDIFFFFFCFSCKLIWTW